MDGPAFAAPFAVDADFVNIRGEHFRGRAAIGAGHAAIFQTIYAGSTNNYELETRAAPAPGRRAGARPFDPGRAAWSARRPPRRAFLAGVDEDRRRVGDRGVAQHARTTPGSLSRVPPQLSCQVAIGS